MTLQATPVKVWDRLLSNFFFSSFIFGWNTPEEIVRTVKLHAHALKKQFTSWLNEHLQRQYVSFGTSINWFVSKGVWCGLSVNLLGVVRLIDIFSSVPA